MLRTVPGDTCDHIVRLGRLRVLEVDVQPHIEGQRYASLHGDIASSLSSSVLVISIPADLHEELSRGEIICIERACLQRFISLVVREGFGAGIHSVQHGRWLEFRDIFPPNIHFRRLEGMDDFVFYDPHALSATDRQALSLSIPASLYLNLRVEESQFPASTLHQHLAHLSLQAFRRGRRYAKRARRRALGSRLLPLLPLREPIAAL